MFKRATRGLEEIINKGRTAMVDVAAVTWFTPLQGGVPIVVDGKVVGAIGVSGAASAQQDEEVALAGAAALTTPQAGNASVGDVTYVAKGVVDAAFESGDTGGTLVDAPAYRVNASRRDGPGQAEIHTEDTDIFYVLSGSATLVTGGELVEPRQIAPAELRGLGIRGGSEQRIGAGDVLTIPRGVPHWFKSVNTPLKYYVVKSTETN
jgi:glc operon protein GlcG